MKYSVCLVLLGGLLLGRSNPGTAQIAPTTCILYVEKMPEIVRNGKQVSIVDAVQEHLIYPLAAIQARAEGRVFISFTITATGSVKDAHLIKGFRPDCDSAALQAVRQLPRFKPGMQLGKPVACGYTVPVKFSLPIKAQRTKQPSLLHKGNPKP